MSGCASSIAVAALFGVMRIIAPSPLRSFIMPMTPILVAIALVLLAMTMFWISQLHDLMASPDDRFPGRHDKIAWVAVMLVWSVFGSLAYWLYASKLAKR
jgi:hypothetical protein